MKRRPGQLPANETRRCAIYVRKSTVKGLEQQFNSLDAQREACVAYVQRQPGWVLVDTEYSDGGFSGGNIERPAFQQLLADVEAKKIDIVVVHRVDRLSRSILDFAKVMERLNASGASFVSVTQNFSTADAMGRLTLNMLMSFAEFEREMISERTRDKVAAARRKGKWTGGPVPFGYDLRDKHLFVSEVEAIAVREAFELFVQHGRISLVARRLNDLGLRPRGSRQPSDDLPRWTKDSIGRVLRSPLYGGLMSAGDERVTGEHPALVDRALFDQVQDILRDGEQDRSPRGNNPAYVLGGILRCSLCGGAMTPASTQKGRRNYRYYRCSTRNKHGTDSCKAAPLAADAIEQCVIDRIRDAVADGHLADDVTSSLERRIKKRRETAATLSRMLPSQIAVHSANASKIADELVNLDGRSREVVASKLRLEGEKLADAERRLAEAERSLRDLDGLVAETTWVLNTLRDFHKIWDVLTPANRGRLLRALIERVSVDDVANRIDIRLIDLSSGPDAPTPTVDPTREAA